MKNESLINIDRLQAGAMLYLRLEPKYSRFVFLVVAISILLSSLGISTASSYYNLIMQSQATISPPDVVLQEGSVGSSTIYANSTSAKVSVTAPIYDFVDINTGDVDSIADKGTHSNFSAQQAGPDSLYDTLTEEGETEVIEDYVDSISDVDSSPDIGTHSSFNNMKAYDSTYDTLNETSGAIEISKIGSDTQGTGSSSPLQWSHTLVSGTNRLVVIAIGWENNGACTVTGVTYGGQTCTEVIQSNTGGVGYLNGAAIYYIDEDTLPSDGSNQVSVTFSAASTADFNGYCMEFTGVDLSGPDDWDETSEASPADATIENTGLSAVATDLCVSVVEAGNTGSFTHGQSQNERIDFTDASSQFAVTDLIATGSISQLDSTFSGTLNRLSRMAAHWSPAAVEYDLDLEVQFTNIIDFLATENLCVYMGTMGAEALNVSYWTGSDWSLLDSDLTASSWNNYTVSLSGVNFTIRFETATLTGDSSADEYQVDAVLLQCSGVGTDEDYIDQTSDVDSTSDVGSHNVFANLQASDDTYDNMTEAGGGGGDYDTTVLGFSPDYRWELDGDETDSVDGAGSDGGNDPSWASNIIPNGATQCGDYDGSTNETLIPNQADINDATTYEKSISVWVEIDTIDTSGNGRVIWGEGGTQNGLALYVLDVGGEDRLYACVYEGTSIDYCYTTISTGTLYHVGMTLDCFAGELILYVNGVQVASDATLAIGSDFATHAAGIAIGGVDSTLNNHNDADLDGFFDGRIADVVYYAEQTVLTEANFNSIFSAGIGGDYQLELEVQFTNIPEKADSLAVQNLCIKAGTMGAEDLLVQYWNGSAWTNLFSDLTALAWNNVTIAGNLTASTFTIRFRDGTQSGDTSTSDSWLIDSVLIYLEISFCYELDLEVQWTSADYTRANEELCIRTGTFSGSETVQVKVWNSTGSSWDWIMNLTANQWNNVSITSYLTSSTFTVQFAGGTETNDTTLDSWNIDATLLNVWTSDDNYDYADNNTWDVDSSADKGTHSNFTAQQYGPDSIYDTLTEDGGGTVWVWQDDTSGYSSGSSYETFQFWSSWTTNSTTSGTITKIGIYVFANPGNSPQVKLGIYDDSGGSPNNLLGETNPATITGVGWLDLDIVGGGVSISASTTYHVSHITDSAPTNQWRYQKTATPVSDYRNNRVWSNLFDPAGPTTKSSSYRYGAYRVGYDEPYRLDLEVQWTNVDYNLGAEKELCIYGGSMASEDLLVDAWNGTEWQNLLVDLSNGWNNVSVSSYLTSSNFSIRFKDDNQASDTNQDSWNIDATLLHVWTSGESYDYVLKVNNTVTDSWQIRLKKYSDSNISRLQKCAIYFHNSTDGNSNQIEIQNGVYIKETGSWYDLDNSETIYIAMTVQANTTTTSQISTYLEVRKPGTTIYAQYIITFEIE